MRRHRHTNKHLLMHHVAGKRVRYPRLPLEASKILELPLILYLLFDQYFLKSVACTRHFKIHY